jgi:hypothetical protein
MRGLQIHQGEDVMAAEGSVDTPTTQQALFRQFREMADPLLAIMGIATAVIGFLVAIAIGDNYEMAVWTKVPSPESTGASNENVDRQLTLHVRNAGKTAIGEQTQ